MLNAQQTADISGLAVEFAEDCARLVIKAYPVY